MRNLIIVSLLSSLAACGGGSKKTEEPSSGPPPGASGKMSADAVQGKCLEIFQKQRACTDVFIPALVGWRVELDVPTGVAAEDKSAGRDTLVAKAKEEWAASNSDEQLTALCTSVVQGIPPEELAGMIELGVQCAAAETCEAFTTCIEPMQRKRLEEQKAAESGANTGE